MRTLNTLCGICVLFLPTFALAESLSGAGAISGAGQAVGQGLATMQQGLIMQQLLETRHAHDMEKIRADQANWMRQFDAWEEKDRAFGVEHAQINATREAIQHDPDPTRKAVRTDAFNRWVDDYNRRGEAHLARKPKP